MDIADGLDQLERACSWQACWDPSFAGIAIVNADLTFRSVNDQFCQICGVTAAEFIGKSFCDITPQPIRDLDVANAKLVMDGKRKSYMMDKDYEFQSGKKVAITLLVVGVYHPKSGNFLHFVSRIMERNSNANIDALHRKQMWFWNWLDKKKIGWGLLTIFASTMAALSDKIAAMIKGL